jgi:hypothetical protein
MSLNWNNIRTLNGSSQSGFEELCAQLARAESVSAVNFERKGTPDAGVECYATLANGDEWGWQAKYFDKLDDAQWAQLDKSVKTALDKHPRIVRYFICIPYDRPDARNPGQRSAMERWNEHVSKWQGWATEAGHTVEYVYWGSSELIERLSRPEHRGRIFFWFETEAFDNPWFNNRRDAALVTAGPRYTPEVHIGLPIAAEFEAFGRTEHFFCQMTGAARSIRKKLRSLGSNNMIPLASEGDGLISKHSQYVLDLLGEFGKIVVQPVGNLPFSKISSQIEETNTKLEELHSILRTHEQEYDEARQKDEKPSRHIRNDNPYTQQLRNLYNLRTELQEAMESFVHGDNVANSQLMILSGEAGTGKTHLLCDVAKQRIAASRPTVLLMGQQFIGKDAPWRQALNQLDLPNIKAEEFVGALEAAAQAANCRALILIDAINEGEGRSIWPNHLAALLRDIEKSPWLGAVLSVRSSYEESVIPEEVRNRAVKVTHEGFTDHEYEAMRAFFLYYKLELPSAPLLAPEFRNPLFLKNLCKGLEVLGHKRLPRGLHGITDIFKLILDSVNTKLARPEELDFNPKHPLVRTALEAIAKELSETDKRWLPASSAEAIVNNILPGRGFAHSLYQGLVVEGLLTENIFHTEGGAPEEMVVISYERFADHMIAKILLDTHLNSENPASSFAKGGPLAFLADEHTYVPSGLIEALCIQVPERAHKELVTLAPGIKKRHGIGSAFRQSLVWRKTDAFSDDTLNVLNKLIWNEYGWHDTLDALLTVATLPGHMLNAHFLDKNLRKLPMADRDAQWSTYLHTAWGGHGPITRLMDWALTLLPEDPLSEESVELCSTALAWMFTASNCAVRDRATIALVCLLAGRFSETITLVERFADVDDPYVTERVYAVAYGVAMRSHDTNGIGALAMCVYAKVFAKAEPPALFLMRDYARGVIERALHCGASLDIDVRLIRPPYNSVWPDIPSEEDIKPFMPDWSRGSHDSGELEWARNTIGFSVMQGDFARDVIGTRSSMTSSCWLSLRLDEPEWKSTEELLAELLAEFGEDAKRAWVVFDESEKALRLQNWLKSGFAKIRAEKAKGKMGEFVGAKAPLPPDRNRLKTNRAAAHKVLSKTLTPTHRRRLKKLLAAKESGAHEYPGFPLDLIQRYVLRRVFGLGWTVELFGEFDRFAVGDSYHRGHGAERMGEKYQWIAYREILAYISDHYQYRDEYPADSDRRYDGPWQGYYRNLDPSCTLLSTHGSSSWLAHTPAWWCTVEFNNWKTPASPAAWVAHKDDLPDVAELLTVVCPKDGSLWIPLYGFFQWSQTPPADQELGDTERRQVWYRCTGMLLRKKDSKKFMKWAKSAAFGGYRAPDASGSAQAFLGEYPWAPASHYFQQPYQGGERWSKPTQACSFEMHPVTNMYHCEGGTGNRSIDDSFSLLRPTSIICEGLKLLWSGVGTDYRDESGALAAFDPCAHEDGPTALLVKRDNITEWLNKEGLILCWMVQSEKQVIGAKYIPEAGAYRGMRGAYLWDSDKVSGFMDKD